MTCLKCGKATLARKAARLPGALRGGTFRVEMEALVCPRCGYATVDGKDMPEYMRLVADAYRCKHGLLTSEEIRRRRKRLGMSQAAFAKHLRVGVASVKRWEMGKVQDSSSDELIRLKTDPAVDKVSLPPWNFADSLHRALDLWKQGPPRAQKPVRIPVAYAA